MTTRQDKHAGGLRRWRRAAGIIAAAAAIAVTAAGCGNGGAAGSVKSGGIFRLGSNSPIDSLNPFVAFQTDASIQHAVPLKLVEDGDGYKLYAGKKWVGIRAE